MKSVHFSDRMVGTGLANVPPMTGLFNQPTLRAEMPQEMTYPSVIPIVTAGENMAKASRQHTGLPL